MKNILVLIVTLGTGVTTFAQDKNNLFKELSENACKCIDSITTTNKTSFLIANKVSNCIDKEVGTYQMGNQLMNSLGNINSLLKEGVAESSKEVTIKINTSKNSEGYKNAYKEFETYLMDNCPVLKQKIATSDVLGIKSMSENEKALKYYYKGINKHQKGKNLKAIKYFKKALAIDPVFAFAWDNLGLSYRKMNQFDEAIHAYERSLKIDPYGKMPLQNIAIAYQYKQDYEKAIEAYKRLAEIDPENPEIYYGIGQVYTVSLNNLEEGLDHICKAYIIYSETKSPFRADAEKLIQHIYTKMKEDGKLETFNAILEKNKIAQ